ncbi:MAG: hypothetical protein AAFV53_38260 [Myxococcota bacterium]
MTFTAYILIPTVGNDGVAFSAAHVAVWDDFLLASFGGFSRLPETVRGAWIDAGVRYDDNTVVYGIALSSIAQGGDFVAAAQFAALHFEQLAIFITYLGVVEIIE